MHISELVLCRLISWNLHFYPGELIAYKKKEAAWEPLRVVSFCVSCAFAVTFANYESPNGPHPHSSKSANVRIITCEFQLSCIVVCYSKYHVEEEASSTTREHAHGERAHGTVCFCLSDLNIARVLTVKWERQNNEVFTQWSRLRPVCL